MAPFEARTGFAVRVVRSRRPSPEQVAAVIDQITAERGDVWWCQEPLTTEILKRAGALARLDPGPAGADRIPSRFHDPDGTWFGFAARARILMVNTDLVPEPARPRSMWDLLDPRWKGKVGLASPTWGTAILHLLALRSSLGEAESARYLNGLVDNDVIVARGDRDLAERIGSGEVLAGMTDTSDCLGVAAAGQPVAMIYPDQHGVGTLVEPNTLAWLASSGNPAGARQLIEFLLSADAERAICAQGRGQMPLDQGVAPLPPTPRITDLRVMDADVARAADLLDTFGAELLRRFGAPGQEQVTGRGAQPLRIDFDDMAVDEAPTGMTVAQTRDGPMCAWKVTADPTAPSGGNVLTQVDTSSEIGGRFPMCLVDGYEARDVSVGVCFKTMTGEIDRAAGLVVRYLDRDNYYCCRVNSLEDNYRFYRVVEGRRIEIAGVNHVPIMENVWQSMRMEARGDRFRLWLNGALMFEARDATFAGPGRVGLWLKGDSVTSFDDLVVSGPGEHFSADFEGDVEGSAPRDMTHAGVEGLDVPWRVVAAGDGAAGRLAVTPGDVSDANAGRAGSFLLAALPAATDVAVSARFKVGTTGTGNHLASLVVRYRGPDDYVNLRINPEECNLRLYRVRDGRRTLIGERHHTRYDEHCWHDATLSVVGARYEVIVDGELQFSCSDPESVTDGRAGVWAAPGDGTRYDAVTVQTFD
ncbi:MAG: extracellular solute-binding protein [Planctomycetes bacterium]|nr:extracellular solute-binding protein [Planctomycetota bacterium]